MRATIPAESFALAVERAREWWAQLTGDRGPYNAASAAAILRLAVDLWPSTAAIVHEDAPGTGQDGP